MSVCLLGVLFSPSVIEFETMYNNKVCIKCCAYVLLTFAKSLRDSRGSYKAICQA